MGHTAKTAFSTTTDWVSAESLTSVFTGEVANVAGEVTVTFSTPFAYNNTDNLIIAVDENKVNFDGGNYFYTYIGVANSSMYVRNDTTNPNPTAPPTAFSRSATKSRVTILGLISSAPDCPVVSAPAVNATATSLTPTITWAAANNATGYKLSVGTTLGGTDVLNAVDLGNVLTYTFGSALSTNTKYYYTVNSYNATLASIGCAERSFTTQCGVLGIPYTQNFESVTAPALPACTTVQNAGTGNNWAVSNLATASLGFSAGKVLRYSYDTNNAANTWFYTPGLIMTGGTTYKLKFRSGGNNPAYTEKLKISYGTAAASTSMTNLIADYPVVEQGTSSVKTVYFTPSTNGTYYIGFNAYSALNQDNLLVDDISVELASSVLPDCAIASNPADAATNVNVRTTFTWADAAEADNYKIYLGTTSGGTDVLNGVAASSGVTLTNNPPLIANTTYYLKIVASNNIGDATGCIETMFTTGANPYAPYCGPFTSATPTQIAPITSLTLNGVTNYSDVLATTFGSFAPNESFTSAPIEVKNNLTTIPFSVTGIASSGNGWGTAVFVDWNNDNDFLDAGEAYYNTTATLLRTTTVTANKATLTGTLAIPAGTTLGQKRMRIKYNFTGTTINSPLTTACTDLTNGQVEDYTIDYTSFLAVSDASKVGASVYPNPFTDVLKISDVKGVKSISISDVSGRLVKTVKATAEIQASELKTGLYIVNLHMEDGSVKSIKAIKK